MLSPSNDPEESKGRRTAPSDAQPAPQSAMRGGSSDATPAGGFQKIFSERLKGLQLVIFRGSKADEVRILNQAGDTLIATSTAGTGTSSGTRTVKSAGYVARSVDSVAEDSSLTVFVAVNVTRLALRNPAQMLQVLGFWAGTPLSILFGGSVVFLHQQSRRIEVKDGRCRSVVRSRPFLETDEIHHLPPAS